MRYFAAALGLGLLVLAGCGGQTIRIEPIRFTDVWDVVSSRYPDQGELAEPGKGVVRFTEEEDGSRYKITVEEVGKATTTVCVQYKGGPIKDGGRKQVAEQAVLKPLMNAVLKNFGSVTIYKPKGLD